MDLITRGLSTGLLIWFALFAALVIGRVMRGDIDTGGMMRHASEDPPVAPERVVNMSIFPVVIVGYAYMALQTNVLVAHPILPDVPNEFLMLLTGGNGLYLAGKIARNP